MNDKTLTITDARLLAAIKAVNPPVETLMADRLALRLDLRAAQTEREAAKQDLGKFQQLREIQIPRYIAIAKALTITAASCALITLILAFFPGSLAISTAASLFASLLLPLVLVELAEREFGKWRVFLRQPPQFVPSNTIIAG